MSRALGLLAIGAAVNGVLASIQTCNNNSSSISCSSGSSSATGSCCLEAPGGLLLQTQFWDTNPAVGPSDSWGIHGLWPDNCDGTYQSNCDSSRAYNDITTLLQNAGKGDLLTYMNKYWQSNDESPEAFWEHEWSTHGTCINTIDPTCYSNYKTGDEAVDFFQRVVTLFKTLDTYTALNAAGITPSSSKTYSLSDIVAAAGKNHNGKEVYFSCKSGELNAASYYFNLRGNAINGQYVAVDSPQKSNCPSSGIKYLPKSGN
ncbi:putative ribonuclease T2 [Talaromyces proteolyticus]|uniref:ribonuclease T2 n=1 Tax=Talaromyces proteolyticus TaxID=1131652 RepID=A0AAD4KXN3_9EURO|nr:putative ribonuclease T2 [Talaromyces proteolyticus]KAH8699153.1 putative ribonuclease T2 [Talaromyces proteolyticus]